VTSNSSNKWPESGHWSPGRALELGSRWLKKLAPGGTHLVLTARRIDRLQKMASDLSAKAQNQGRKCSHQTCPAEAPAEILDLRTGRASKSSYW